MNDEWARISKLMEKGILSEEKTGLLYFTGYDYKTLYDWDQYFEAIVQIYLGWEDTYIKNAIYLFLDNQHDNGMIGRSVPDYGEHAYEHVKPFLAQTAWLVYKKERDLSWLSSRYDRLKKYLLYWLIDLDGNNNGLSTWRSAPHTGMDNQHERAGWWGDYISEGVDLASYLYRECLAISEIALVYGKSEDASLFKSYARKIKKAVNTLLWDDEDGIYYDLNAKTGKKIKVKSVSSFAPLWAGIATDEQAKRLVNEHILNPAEFWRAFPLPALAATEEGYSEVPLENDLGCSWRANTWIPSNYYVFQGLRKYGYIKEAAELAKITYDRVNKIGDREYYNTETSTGAGLDPFWGWSLLAHFMPYEQQTGFDPTALEATPFSTPCEDRLVGMAYTTWNRPDIWKSDVWARPLLGEYSSDDRSVIRQHAKWLSDAGVDFIWIDWSNDVNYDPNKMSYPDFDMIEYSTKYIFEEYQKLEKAPKISIFIGCPDDINATTDGRLQRKADQVYDWFVKNPQYRPLMQDYLGKPLLVVYLGTPSPLQDGVPSWDDDRFTVRYMTGFVSEQPSLHTEDRFSKYGYWSWEDRGEQTFTMHNGFAESMIVNPSTRPQTANGEYKFIPSKGRNNGESFRESFARAREIGVKFAMVGTWNEWVIGEQNSVEVSKDIEPNDAHGHLYLDILKEEIKKFKGR